MLRLGTKILFSFRRVSTYGERCVVEVACKLGPQDLGENDKVPCDGHCETPLRRCPSSQRRIVNFHDWLIVLKLLHASLNMVAVQSLFVSRCAQLR